MTLATAVLGSASQRCLLGRKWQCLVGSSPASVLGRLPLQVLDAAVMAVLTRLGQQLSLLMWQLRSAMLITPPPVLDRGLTAIVLVDVTEALVNAAANGAGA